MVCNLRVRFNSDIFEKIDSTEIERSFSGLSASPFLKVGITVASLKTCGGNNNILNRFDNLSVHSMYVFASGIV